jgi:hypothetical protein
MKDLRFIESALEQCVAILQAALKAAAAEYEADNMWLKEKTRELLGPIVLYRAGILGT